MEVINQKFYNWASLLDVNARLQTERTARLPFVERVALMPDAHLGRGATVGSVIGTNGAIMPSAVGVDIGCGMAAVHWNMRADQLPDDLERFMPEVSRSIPAGVGQGHSKISKGAEEWWAANEATFSSKIDNSLRKKALEQFGTLGSGNHFFEICLDENDEVWFVLHSGSRGLGNILASHHIKEAKELAKRENRHLEDTDLAYFLDTDDGFYLYIEDMVACQNYALNNREQMLTSVMRAWQAFMVSRGVDLLPTQVINCHHNFTQKETHDGKDIWVTRKGAIKAFRGDLGIIPGSMGTRSFIVQGLGNEAAYSSCSHGAGRVHSRSAAKKLFTQADLEHAMQGKVWNSRSAASLVDEIPGAYKDIDTIMEDQKDLAEPIHTLRQVLNFKGC